MSREPLLLIEDMPSLQMVYEAVLRNAGHDVVTASTAAEGMARFREVAPRVILLDLVLPDQDGLELMQEMLALDPAIRVIVITANGSINRAVSAMRAGAFEFLVKPFDETRLVSVVETARAETAPHVAATPTQGERPGRFHGFIGSSRPMRDVYRKISAISRSSATVFITGESGTGKEVCAQAVHATSTRARGPFVPLNCGAIPSDLLESEVFGHLKGSFTGAIADKVGAAGAADGGTLFLDEICEMDMNLQTKLLRFVQTSMIQPVGAVTARKVDVRIICATNRDPHEEVRRGRLREDLFYRLHVVPIHLPPLRERGDDAIEIAEEMLRIFSAEEGKKFSRLDDDVRALFRRLSWPGNVRQLLNVLRNVVVLNEGDTITSTMLPMEILHLGESGKNALQTTATSANPIVQREMDGLIGRPLAEIERLVIEETIARNAGSVSRAARVLEVAPSTLYRKLETWKKGDR